MRLKLLQLRNRPGRIPFLKTPKSESVRRSYQIYKRITLILHTPLKTEVFGMAYEEFSWDEPYGVPIRADPTDYSRNIQ